MGATPMQLHKDAVTSAEVTRQNAMAVPGTVGGCGQGGRYCVSPSGGHVGDGQLGVAGGIVDGAARAWRGCPPALPSVTPHGAVTQLPTERPSGPEKPPPGCEA